MQATTYGKNKYLHDTERLTSEICESPSVVKTIGKTITFFPLSLGLIETRKRTWKITFWKRSWMLAATERFKYDWNSINNFFSAYSLQGSCLVKRINCSMLHQMRPMPNKAETNKPFWGRALLQVAQLHHRTITPALDMKTPEEVLSGNASKNSKMGIFGCAAYAHKHSKVGIFGYAAYLHKHTTQRTNNWMT